MTALSAIRKKAREEYPGFELEFDSGQTVTLKSFMDLDDIEFKQFNASQKKLSQLDESEDLENLKEEFVNLLAGVSTDKALTAVELDKESMGTLSILFRDYATSVQDAAKS
jgi:hypothetical protein